MAQEKKETKEKTNMGKKQREFMERRAETTKKASEKEQQ